MLPFPGPLSTINQYSIDQKTGGLTFIGAVEMPRNKPPGSRPGSTKLKTPVEARDASLHRQWISTGSHTPDEPR